MHSWSFRLNAIFTFTVSALGALSALNILSVSSPIPRPKTPVTPPPLPAAPLPLNPPVSPMRTGAAEGFHAEQCPHAPSLPAQVIFLDPSPIATIDNVKLQRLPGSG
jgi:hypothetical protein